MIKIKRVYPVAGKDNCFRASVAVVTGFELSKVPKLKGYGSHAKQLRILDAWSQKNNMYTHWWHIPNSALLEFIKMFRGSYYLLACQDEGRGHVVVCRKRTVVFDSGTNKIKRVKDLTPLDNGKVDKELGSRYYNVVIKITKEILYQELPDNQF